MQLSKTAHASAGSKQTARVLIDFEIDATEGGTMQPFGLNKEAAERQNAQNNDYRNDDDLNQAHSEFLSWLRANS